jgi:predicted porin
MMKKSLLATTAIAALGAVAVASPASAKFEVSVAGYMEQWFGYTDSSDSANPDSDTFEQHSDNEFFVRFSQTLDNGIKIGGEIQVEGENAGDIDEQYMYMQGSFGKVIVGTENAAAYLMHYGVASKGIGIDEGDAANVWIVGANGALNRTSAGTAVENDFNSITYITPRVNGFQVGATYIPELGDQDDRVPRNNAGMERDGRRDNAWSLAGNYQNTINDLKLMASLGYIDGGDDDGIAGDNTALSAGLRVGFGGFTASFAYGEHERDDAGAETDTNIFGVGINYQAGPAGVSVSYLRGEDSDNDTDQDMFELGASYKVGPGVTAAGSIYYGKGQDGANTVADGIAVAGGLKLSF